MHVVTLADEDDGCQELVGLQPPRHPRPEVAGVARLFRHLDFLVMKDLLLLVVQVEVVEVLHGHVLHVVVGFYIQRVVQLGLLGDFDVKVKVIVEVKVGLAGWWGSGLNSVDGKVHGGASLHHALPVEFLEVRIEVTLQRSTLHGDGTKCAVVVVGLDWSMYGHSETKT